MGHNVTKEDLDLEALELRRERLMIVVEELRDLGLPTALADSALRATGARIASLLEDGATEAGKGADDAFPLPQSTFSASTSPALRRMPCRIVVADDTTTCHTCHLTWDTNDDPGPCVHPGPARP
jgi:hypothetical protein